MEKYSMIFSDGVFLNQVKVYVVDTLAKRDLIDISQLSAGSRVYITSDSQWYILKNNREWYPL